MDFETIVRIVNLSVGTIVAVVGIIIAFLTYKKAKATILQPMRNEVFKLQIKEFTSIMELFIGRDGVRSLWEVFDFDKIIDWNSFVLTDAYLTLFDRGSDPANRPYNKDNCIMYVFDIDDDEDTDHSTTNKEYFIIPGFYISKSIFEEGFPKTIDERLKLWENYRHKALIIPNEVETTREKIRILYSSPVLPSLITGLLQQSEKILDENYKNMLRALTSCSKDIPSFSPTPDTLDDLIFIASDVKMKVAGWRPRENNTLPQTIVQSIRDYLGSDEILKK